MELKFSVIIPTYNRSATLSRAIQSVLAQTLPVWEVIVVDDGSSDDTRKLIESFSQVQYHYQSNAGVCDARNKGAEIATGDWLVFLDSDDELMPSALADFSNAAIKKTSMSIISGGYFLSKNGIETKYVHDSKKYIGNLSGSFSIRKKVFKQIGGYDSKLKFAENTELFFRLNRLDLERIVIPIPVMRYYQDSSGGSSNLMAMSESIIYILEKHPDLDPRVKRLYHQILGVNYMRFRMFSEARFHLWKAFLFRPRKLDTLARYGIAMIPILAKRLYSPIPQSR